MQEVHNTEDAELYVRGPDDLVAWARQLQLGWRPGVVIAHLDELERFRCLTELPGASLEHVAAERERSETCALHRCQ